MKTNLTISDDIMINDVYVSYQFHYYFDFNNLVWRLNEHDYDYDGVIPEGLTLEIMEDHQYELDIKIDD